MAKNKQTTRRPPVQNHQQLQVDLPDNYVLALAAPPLPPHPPPPPLPSPSVPTPLLERWLVGPALINF